MANSYNCESAKILARNNGLTLKDIKTHRSDGKATINNVKDAIRQRNSFGKNFGLGMMGNPTPFKTR